MQEGTFGDKIGAYECGSTASDTSIGFKYLPINWRWNLRKQSDFTSWDKVPWYSKAIAAVSLFGWTLYKDYRMVEDGKDQTDTAFVQNHAVATHAAYACLSNSKDY